MSETKQSWSGDGFRIDDLSSEEPHAMLCVHHGGSPACEDENEKHRLVCPECLASGEEHNYKEYLDKLTRQVRKSKALDEVVTKQRDMARKQLADAESRDVHDPHPLALEIVPLVRIE